MTNKPLDVEAEHNEMILQNSFGDRVIIPAAERLWVKRKLAEGCHKCIDEYVATLPTLSQYAQDGTVYPQPPPKNWLQMPVTPTPAFNASLVNILQQPVGGKPVVQLNVPGGAPVKLNTATNVANSNSQVQQQLQERVSMPKKIQEEQEKIRQAEIARLAQASAQEKVGTPQYVTQQQQQANAAQQQRDYEQLGLDQAGNKTAMAGLAENPHFQKFAEKVALPMMDMAGLWEMGAAALGKEAWGALTKGVASGEISAEQAAAELSSKGGLTPEVLPSTEPPSYARFGPQQPPTPINLTEEQRLIPAARGEMAGGAHELTYDQKAAIMKQWIGKNLPNYEGPGKEILEDMQRRLLTPEGLRRREVLSAGENIANVKLKVNPYETASADIFDNIHLNPYLSDAEIEATIRHELEHHVQGSVPTEIDDDLKGLELKRTPTEREKYLAKGENIMQARETYTKEDWANEARNLNQTLSDPQAATDYYYHMPKEKSAMLAELQPHAVKQGYIGRDWKARGLDAPEYDQMTPEIMKDMYTDYLVNMANDKLNTSTFRIFDIMKPTRANFELLARNFNKLLTGAGVGAGTYGAYKMVQNNQQQPQQQ